MQGVPQTLSLNQLGKPNYMDAAGNKVRLTGDQAAATLDPAVRRNNPLYAAAHEYRDLAPENNLTHQLGAGIHNIFTRPNFMGRVLDKGPLVGAAALGGLGAAAGYGTSALLNRGKSEAAKKKRRRAALLAGLTGAAAGAYSGMWRTKNAAWMAGRSDEGMQQDARQMIVRMLRNASDVSSQERRALSDGVMKLDNSEARDLLELVGPVSGFAIGALVAKFLARAGVLGTLAGGLAGSMIGRALQPSPPRNAFGQPSMNHRDLFGNPLR